MQLFDWQMELVVVAAAHPRIQGSTRDAHLPPQSNFFFRKNIAQSNKQYTDFNKNVVGCIPPALDNGGGSGGVRRVGR